MTARILPDYVCPRAGCGVTFRPVTRSQKFCSRRCADLGRRVVRDVVCRRTACSREFTVGKHPRVYCSRECWTQDQRERRPVKTCPRCSATFRVRSCRAETQTHCSKVCAEADRAVPEIQCPACHEQFKPKQRRQQFCSVECSHTSARRGRPKGPRLPAITCTPCGRSFHPRRSKQRFCSRECGFAGQSRDPRSHVTTTRTPAAPLPVDIPDPPTQREIRVWRPKSWGGSKLVTIGGTS